MTNLTRIVAAVLDTKQVTLYKDDGTTIVMLQGDVRLRSLLEHITPLLTSQGWADVDLSEQNSWKEFEESTNGAVRLFRIARSKLAGFFGTKKEESQPDMGVIGKIPTADGSPNKVVKNVAAVDEIMRHATPVTSDGYTEQNVAAQRPTVESDGITPNDIATEGKDSHFEKHAETIIAVTPKGNVVAGVEQIKSQFASAAKSGNTKGMVLFLERLGAVSANRSHTAQDLLRFMERGDLPVADDGTIIIYKKLNRCGDRYTDVHSGKVTQRVGSYVHMDASLVDNNRRNECSNGLHVARRGYIRNFSGDVIVLAKVRPEDVIAVPDYDANKMRVCGYHIIAELTAAQYQAINSNRPLSEAEGGELLLGQAIAGDHIGIIEQVKIGGHNGSNLTITEISTGEEPVEEKVEAVPEKVETKADIEAIASELAEVTPAPASKVAKPAIKKKISKSAKKAKRKVAIKKASAKITKEAKPLEAAGVNNDKPVDVRAVNQLKAGTAENLSLEKKPMVTQNDVVKALWDAALGGDSKKAQELLDYKKKAKKGWHTWGLPDTAGDTLKALLDS